MANSANITWKASNEGYTTSGVYDSAYELLESGKRTALAEASVDGVLAE